MARNYNLIAANILKEIIFASLATVSDNGKPLSTPVFYAYDNNLNLYWGSPYSTNHSKNVRANGKVAFVVYDAKVKPDDAFGVYGEGLASELDNKQTVLTALKCTYGRFGDTPPDPSNFLGANPVRMYKLVVNSIWMNDADKKDDIFIDYRVELDREVIRRLLFSKTS